MNLEAYVEEYKNGNEKAFHKIYQETFSLVRFAIYGYIQDKAIVEDLIQDTYMKVSERISSYQSHNFQNWIYTIAKNTAVDYIRKRKESSLENTAQVPAQDTHPYLKYALNHLDDNLREVFLMKVLCGHTTKKIALALNKKPSEVNQMYYQAKAILKKCLEEDSYEFKKI